MTKRHEIIIKYIQDLSVEIPNAETFIFSREHITKYVLGINISTKTLTITLEHLTTSNNTNTANVSVVGTQSGAGPTSSSMVTYDFTSSLDSGTNAVSAGDMLFLGFASSASTGNILFYVTSLWEWDYS